MTSQIDPESVVLGALCKSQSARKLYLDKVETADFSNKGYAKIFDAVFSLSQAGHNVTLESVSSFFTETMDRMMVTFLFDTNTPGTVDQDTFTAFKKSGIRARQVRLRDFLDRELKKLGDPEALTEQVREMVAQLEGGTVDLETVGSDVVVDSTEYLLDQWAKGELPVVSGLPELDEQLFLSQFLGYWVIAGNSGVGKSALMAGIAKVNAQRGVPGIICSLEMRKELLYIRMAMDDPRVRGLELNSRTIKDPQKISDLKYSLNSLRRLPIYVIDGTKNIFQIEKKVRDSGINYGSRWCLFDYIQLGQTKPADSDVVRVYTVSRKLQGLTKPDLPNGYKGMEVIALSQYANEATKSKNYDQQEDEHGRKTKKRPPRPSNSDLAWSGQIKQDADGIIHLYPSSDLESAIMDIDIHCGKQRNYKAGWTVPARFIKSEQRFVTDLSIKMENTPIIHKPKERSVQF